MNAVSNLFVRVGIDLKNPAHVKKMVLVFILVVLIIATAVKYFGGEDVADAAGAVSYSDVGENGAPEGTPAVGDEAAIDETAVPLAANSDIYIDVSGAVEKPCVVCLPAGSRVFDAIDAAGGLAESADTRTINQAAILEDGQKVYVPTSDEVEAGTVPVQSGSVAADAGAGVAGGGGGDAVQNGKININKANADDLQQLSGIGPALSQRIIDYRDAHGAFKKIEDIKNVSGIGDKTFEKFAEVITV
jgi:competence protein ComEA